MIKIKDLPIEVYYTKRKKFILSLNQYRNAHYHTLSKAKKAYKELLWHKLPNKHLGDCVGLTYEFYPRRECDVGNFLSVVDKFTSDVLVDKGCITDDNYEHVVEIGAKYIKKDKDNPHFDLIIKKI